MEKRLERESWILGLLFGGIVFPQGPAQGPLLSLPNLWIFQQQLQQEQKH